MPDIAQEMRAEVCATLAYSVTPLKGVDAGKYLMDLAVRPEGGRPRGENSGHLHVWHYFLALFC